MTKRRNNMTKTMRAAYLLLVLMLVCSSGIALVGCDDKLGNFYSLQEAYDNGWLTQENLQSIAYYYYDRFESEHKDTDFKPVPKQELTRQMERNICQTYLMMLKETCPYAKLNNVSICYYYGTYGDCVIVHVTDDLMFYDLIIEDEEIGTVMFYRYTRSYLNVYYVGSN